jgi:hypothetical protein
MQALAVNRMSSSQIKVIEILSCKTKCMIEVYQVVSGEKQLPYPALYNLKLCSALKRKQYRQNC